MAIDISGQFDANDFDPVGEYFTIVKVVYIGEFPSKFSSSEMKDKCYKMFVSEDKRYFWLRESNVNLRRLVKAFGTDETQWKGRSILVRRIEIENKDDTWTHGVIDIVPQSPPPPSKLESNGFDELPPRDGYYVIKPHYKRYPKRRHRNV